MVNLPYKIVCFGDSTTDASFTSKDYPKEYASLKPYTSWLDEKLPKILNRDIIIINSGVSGDTTNDAKIRFEKDVLHHNPDLVIIQFGANDQSIRQDLDLKKPAVEPDHYAYNLLYFIYNIKKINAHIILMTPGVLLWNESFKKTYFKTPYITNERYGLTSNLQNYIQLIRKICISQKIPLIDIFEKEIAYDNQPNNNLFNLLPDGLHPNNKGHFFIANEILFFFKTFKLH
ncbi:SGNH/GDSL hydrolase family protein [Tenacibaculum maritimum]|uniref:SGNH/GDSL hydrolase family protein n=1 Tax=Tenacibaculum maritimum TaxID=107401 RepID=UPI0038774D55